MVPSMRGQQATPRNNTPTPTMRAMASTAPEISVPNKSLTMLRAMINASPVTASSVEATASSTLFVMSPGSHIVVVALKLVFNCCREFFCLFHRFLISRAQI